MHRQLDEVATGLERLTKQLNNFEPVSKNVAGEREQRISTKVIESLNQSVEIAQQEAADNTGLLQDLLVGLENMGENMKRFREEMEEWRNPDLQMVAEREHAHLNEELLQEVSLSIPVTSAPSQNEMHPCLRTKPHPQSHRCR